MPEIPPSVPPRTTSPVWRFSGRDPQTKSEVLVDGEPARDVLLWKGERAKDATTHKTAAVTAARAMRSVVKALHAEIAKDPTRKADARHGSR